MIQKFTVSNSKQPVSQFRLIRELVQGAIGFQKCVLGQIIRQSGITAYAAQESPNRPLMGAENRVKCEVYRDVELTESRRFFAPDKDPETHIGCADKQWEHSNSA